MESLVLFELDPRDEPVAVASSSRLGAVAEQLAIVRLLELGHSVAVPVVDEGIDLVVNYRTTVQVKSSARSEFTLAQSDPARGRVGRRSSADVFLLFDRVVGTWWVVPASVVAGFSSRNLRLRPGALSPLQEWREAWGVFYEEVSDAG